MKEYENKTALAESGEKRMSSYTELPEGYREILRIDLQKDKKLMLLVNGLAAVIMLAMLVVAFCVVPFSTMIDFINVSNTYIRLLVMLALLLLYVVLHEVVHGIVMRRFCSAKVKFGFTGTYAFAGSQGYYCRKHYTIIALAPIVVWGIVLLIANFFVSEPWFYVVYFVQAANISGAAGDLYVSWKMSKLPKDILVQDSGVSMTVYSKEG